MSRYARLRGPNKPFPALSCVSGRRGVFTGASGLQLAYVSGREALQEPAPAHCFTSKDLSALVASLTGSSKFKGVDILLTSQWPRGVWHYGNNPVTLSSWCILVTMVTVSGIWFSKRSFGVRVAGSGHKVVWKRLHCQPRWQTETAVPLCCTRGRALWKAAIQVQLFLFIDTFQIQI